MLDSKNIHSLQHLDLDGKIYYETNHDLKQDFMIENDEQN